ncbi:HdeD family acid-resistance protein [Streptomyces sp. NPDC001268]|uniref:HdeD family acid-resistance protein n=1 Tax=Streptomyces sp. NPDC001268 TaxID=3364553 RepID=UPI0036BECCE7
MTPPSDSPSGTGTAPQHGTEPPDTSLGGSLAALANMSWQILLTTGLSAIALGVVVLAWPEETLRVVGVLFGIYLLVIGVFQLAAAFGTHIPGHLRAMHFVTGALSVLLGLICFRGTMQSILLLALWIGFSWLLRGTMVTVTAASTPDTPARGWMLFTGIIGMLAGIVPRSNRSSGRRKSGQSSSVVRQLHRRLIPLRHCKRQAPSGRSMWRRSRAVSRSARASLT